MAGYRSSKIRSIGICAAIAVGTSLGVLAPPALAAPQNDQFANRTDLGDELPVHRTESNAEATVDAGVRVGLFAKGHSIWWEWESPASQWTTVGTCDSAFLTVVGVFEGIEPEFLTPLSTGNADEGPGCYATGTRYTFWAEAGKHYDIGADGNGFYLPPQEPPSGEGTIDLTIEATPRPPNDDLADAAPITTVRSFTSTDGYNWGATAEPGEPEHAGVPGGASVWYRWTAPISGEARIGVQGAATSLLGLYTGATLTELTPVGATGAPFTAVQAKVTAGTEYRIAVDGRRSETTDKPGMGSFQLSISMPGLDPPEPPPSCGCMGEPQPIQSPVQSSRPKVDRAPTVKLGGHRVDAKGTATFRFSSTAKGARFKCKVDHEHFRACTSPFKVAGLKPGGHSLAVVASYRGTSGPTPAVVDFRVPAAHRHRHPAG